MRKGLFILSELSQEDLEWMLTIATSEELEAGTTIIEEGKPIHSVYIVLQGTLVVEVAALEGKEIAKIGIGEILGEMSFLDTRPPSATVTVLEDAIVLSIPRLALEQKLERDTAFAARFYRAIAVFLSNRLRLTVSHLGYEEQAPSERRSVNSNPRNQPEKSVDRLIERLEAHRETIVRSL
ncbi:cyclic nucleotide-binding domain-containing protein [Oxynema aestuarii]|jgi:CRP/FNR family cyclic AMP-dependent transcriptional regulator|uniref:Cyclic nucleotide-binding domain-containing protein n=1 Tax=Oxynema aestuarii AP17 TaxID=2064643 RepID=A0A6H1U4E5_9CYAN|nr:cyclic nucleotide-binding domain-containing protein [Oxynema aestuarii]QIZ72903.1 cyclic nucleotide-binding domain-containing protein [Oxynema aestuarii AP17]RMH78653.1 MAG: cyclic nucleotide-binding protein [Cyanobacteria bacterium J007]